MSHTKRAVGYVRVSTEDQVDGESPNTQKTEIEQYCKAHGWELLDIKKDLGISGSKSANRPEWNKIQNMAISNECDVVVFLKLSRFARNAREALNIEHELSQHGVALVSIKERFDTTTSSGKLNFQMLAMFAEFEREVIMEQMNDNKMAKWRDLRMFNGVTPYGYSWNKEAAKMETHPEEAKLLHRIFRLYANTGLSMKDITIKLNNEGYKGRRAAWANATIGGIFDNRAYGTGQLVTNKYVYNEDGNRTKELKPESEWIIYPVPRIISSSLWEKVQARREFNRKKQKRTTWQQEYWLRDNMTCSNCGGKLVAKRGSSRKDGTYPRYYACFWGTTSAKDLQSSRRKKCDSTFIYADGLEEYIWDRLTGELVGNWHVDDEEKRQAEADDRFNKLFGSENIENRIAETKQTIHQIQKKISGKELANQRFAGELEKPDIDVPFCMRKIQENQREIVTLIGNISELEDKLAELKDVRQDQDYWLENNDILFDVWRDMQHFSPEDKKRFLESLVPGGITVLTHPKINSMLGPTTIDLEVVFNYDIFQMLMDEGKFPSLGKNGPLYFAGPFLCRSPGNHKNLFHHGSHPQGQKPHYRKAFQGSAPYHFRCRTDRRRANSQARRSFPGP